MTDADIDLETATRFEGKYLVTENPEALKRASKSLLSHSTSSRVQSCPAKHLAEANLPRTVDPLGPGELGNDGHEVLERMYQLDPAERTKRTALDLITKQEPIRWDELTGYTDADREHWRSFVTKAVLGDFVLEDPESINVHSTELQILGTKLPNDVGMVGYVDRIDYASDGTLLIRDYKTGKFRKHNPRFGVDEKHHQLRNYAACVSAEFDIEVTGATLLYTTEGKSDEVPLDGPSMQGTFDYYRKGRDLLDQSVDSGKFKATPSALCGWCPLANSCPVANVKSEKAKANAAKYPTYDIPVFPAVTNGRKPRSTAADKDNAPQTATQKETPVTTATVQPELPAYEDTHENGDLNLDSYAATGVLATHHFALRLVLENRDIWHLQGASFVEAINVLASAVGATILRVQTAATGRASWRAMSNTRVRAIVYSLIESDLPEISVVTDEELRDYFSVIGKKSLLLFQQGVGLYESIDLDIPDLSVLAAR